MEELLRFPVIAGVVTFITSLLFIYLRTINVKYIANDMIAPAILSGLGVATAWLVSTAIGVSAVLTFEILPMLGHLAGGAVGTYIAMSNKKKR